MWLWLDRHVPKHFGPHQLHRLTRSTIRRLDVEAQRPAVARRRDDLPDPEFDHSQTFRRLARTSARTSARTFGYSGFGTRAAASNSARDISLTPPAVRTSASA